MANQVSIIVPVYNAESKIRQCIESILNQSYKALELILIDDGSTDNSRQICNEYGKKDKRVIVIHQENSGVSSARNAGIDAAQGTHLAFVDSDDELLPYALESGMLEITNNSADIFIGGYVRVNYLGVSNCTLRHPLIGYFNELTEKDVVCLFEHNYIAPCWGKIYSKNFVGKTRFDTSMIFGEDLKFNVELISKEPFIVGSDKSFYKYVAVDNSLTSRTDEQKCKNVIETYSILYKYGSDRHFLGDGFFFTYVDKRWRDDLLTLENMILREESSIICKYRRIRILCSDERLIDRLANIPDKYVVRFAIKPINVILGYLISRMKE